MSDHQKELDLGVCVLILQINLWLKRSICTVGQYNEKTFNLK